MPNLPPNPLGSAGVLSWSGQSTRFFQQGLGLDQVRRVNPFGEPATDPGQQLASLASTCLTLRRP